MQYNDVLIYVIDFANQIKILVKASSVLQNVAHYAPPEKLWEIPRKNSREFSREFPRKFPKFTGILHYSGISRENSGKIPGKFPGGIPQN